MGRTVGTSMDADTPQGLVWSCEYSSPVLDEILREERVMTLAHTLHDGCVNERDMYLKIM